MRNARVSLNRLRILWGSPRIVPNVCICIYKQPTYIDFEVIFSQIFFSNGILFSNILKI